MKYKWLIAGLIILLLMSLAGLFWFRSIEWNDEAERLGLDSVIISDDERVTLTVPAAALPAGVTASDITIKKHEYQDEVLYKFTPDGTTFVEPVTVNFTLTGIPESLPLLIQSDANGAQIVPQVSTEVDYATNTTIVSAAIDHFSTAYVSLHGFFALDITEPVPHLLQDTWPFQIEWNLQTQEAKGWRIDQAEFKEFTFRHADPWTVSGSLEVPLPFRLITEPYADDTLPKQTEFSDRIQFTDYADFQCVEVGESAFNYSFTLLHHYTIDGKEDIFSYTTDYTMKHWPVTCLADDAEVDESVTTGTGDNANTNANTNSNANAAPEMTSVEVLAIDGGVYPSEQFHLADPDACSEQHWHASGKVYTLDLTGNTSDPKPTGCGFGTLADVPSSVVEVELWEYEVFREGIK